MFQTLKRYKGILLLIIVVILLFVGYTTFFKDKVPEGLLTADDAGPAKAVERELLGLLLELKSIELDGAIFADPAFQSLQDFSKDLIPLPIGRSNPFAPFGVGNFPAGGGQ